MGGILCVVQGDCETDVAICVPVFPIVVPVKLKTFDTHSMRLIYISARAYFLKELRASQ
jgi:hypothetical protein